MQALFGSYPPPLVLSAPPAATRLNFPGAERQLNSGLHLSAFSPSRVGFDCQQSIVHYISRKAQLRFVSVLVFVLVFVLVHLGLGLAIFMP